MAPWINCLAPLPFWAIGLWMFVIWPPWLGLIAFVALFVVGSAVGNLLFKRYATAQQIKDDLRARLSND